MKKTFICLFIITTFCIQMTGNVYAAGDIKIEPITNGANFYPLVYNENGDPPETVQINGETYLGDSIRNTCIQIKDDPAICDVLKQPGYDWDFDGEYYLKRYSTADYNPGRSKFKRMTFSIYDKNFNFVRESPTFDGYINDVGFYDGVYYCNVDGAGYFTSSDLENWTKVTNNRIYVDHVGDASIRYIYAENIVKTISINGSDFYSVAYEFDTDVQERFRHFGNWLLQDSDTLMYLTNDDIYAVPLADATLLNGLLPENRGYETYVYEYGDELIVEWRFYVNSFSQAHEELKGYRIRIPKQPVYDALEAQKSAPYVCVNNTILGFETPPVTESDRTLVPMRFLFEQLGADVTWDEATETATAVKANTTISFSIDNTTATVNGAETVMDVPARLVGDKTMVPLRFLSEEMGYTVEWDEETRMATITTQADEGSYGLAF